MRLLVVNPNTSPDVTRRIARAARAAASPGTVIVPVSAPFGVALIERRADLALAARGCVAAVGRNASGCHAVLIAASLDPALEALQRGCALPVVGMTSAALAHARALGAGPVGVLAAGERMRALFLERFGKAAADRVHAVDLDPAGALRDRSRAARVLALGIAELARLGARVAIPLGATVAGLARGLARGAPIPVLDSIACAVQAAESLAAATRAALPR